MTLLTHVKNKTTAAILLCYCNNSFYLYARFFLKLKSVITSYYHPTNILPNTNGDYYQIPMYGKCYSL